MKHIQIDPKSWELIASDRATGGLRCTQLRSIPSRTEAEDKVGRETPW